MYFDSSNWETYTPGVWHQDVFTLAIEAGLTGALGHLGTPPAGGVFPFQDETTNRQRQPTRHPGRVVAPYAITSALGAFTYSYFSNDSFATGPMVRGLIHTHLLTEIATSGAKNFFGRKRPVYDYEFKNNSDTLRVDDRRSFFSGHASHAYAFVHYSSRMVFDNAKHKWAAALYGVGAYTAAAAISTARAIDGQHNWTDILAGGIVGFSISEFTYRRTVKYGVASHQNAQAENNLSFFVSSFEIKKSTGLKFDLSIKL